VNTAAMVTGLYMALWTVKHPLLKEDAFISPRSIYCWKLALIVARRGLPVYHPFGPFGFTRDYMRIVCRDLRSFRSGSLDTGNATDDAR